MSMFGQILSSIFGSSTKVAGALAQAALPGLEPVSSAPASAQSGAQAKPAQTVDVAEVLTRVAEKSDEDLDWRRSIVDLLKLLKLDSSLASRKRLAQELGYAGNMDDSASLNIWLHKQVMAKLAEHGGKVPDELRS